MTIGTSRSISDTVGATPLVRLNRLVSTNDAQVLIKLESLNPWGSVKDRIALEIINEAEAAGKLKPGGHVVEATSGNTGISLAAICAARGYRLTIIMPEFVSDERKILLRMLGAELIFTPTDQALIGPVAKSFEYLDQHPDAFLADQTRNPNNPKAHIKTGEEIWRQAVGQVDIFVAASGTGGHISGIGRFLKGKNRRVQVIAVEPKPAAVLSGQTALGKADGNHGIIGIGPGFIPQTLDRNVIDDVYVIDVEDAYKTAREVIAQEGMLIGTSSGAVIHAAVDLAKRKENKGKTIVTVAASSAERYLSTQLAEAARAYVGGLKPEAVAQRYIDNLLGT